MNSSKVNEGITGFQRFEFFLAVIHRMLIGFVTIYVTWLCLRRITFAQVPWHALFCTIGFNSLMAEGLISYYKGNSSTYSVCRNGKIGHHIALQVLGSLMGTAGIVIRMRIDTIHFTTLHGQLGLAALILCSLSLIFGLNALHSAKLKECVQPIINKTSHSVLGIATFTIAIVCLILGFDTTVFNKIVPMDCESCVNVKIFLKIATLGSLILTIYGPLGTAIQKVWNYYTRR